ncbi:MAG: hypothetical protein DRO12_00630 [Thermoprotei archaeon]|nr:MAG: hypothetical protein DRO12_00630 [Thermoprotei archaeon]
MILKLVFVGGLRRVFGGGIEIKLGKKMKLRDLIEVLVKKNHRLAEVLDTNGPKPGYLLFINDVDYQVLSGMDTEIDDDDVLTLVPVNHGG